MTAPGRPLFLDAAQPEPDWEPPAMCTRCGHSEGLHWTSEEDGSEGCDWRHFTDPCPCRGFRERQPAA